VSAKKKGKYTQRSPALAALHEFRPKGREQWVMFLIGMAVACYVALVLLGKLFLMLPLYSGWPVFLLFPALAPAVYWLMCFALYHIPDKPAAAIVKRKTRGTADEAFLRRLRNLKPTVHSAREQLSPKVFACAFFAVFAVLIIGLLAYYPGHFLHSDIRTQWEQVRTGVFINWHPPIHSMIIWLVTRIHHSYGMFIAAQILFFSLLCGYMAATMRAWGFHDFWTALFVVAVLCAHKVMLYAYKDSMFTCFVLWCAVCLINTALSRGAWLGKWSNRLVFAVTLAFAFMLRANGMAFTAAAVVLLCVFYAKKQTVACVFTGALALLIVAGTFGPLYKAARVTDGRIYGVSYTTLPLVILGSIYQMNPGALDAQGQRFMESLATPYRWKNEVRFGDCRTMMLLFPSDLETYVEEQKKLMDNYLSFTSPKQLVSMLAHAVKNEPNLALKAAAINTSIAWDPFAFSRADYHDEYFREFVIRQQDNDYVMRYLTRHDVHPELIEEILAASKSGFLRAFQTPYRIINGIRRYFPPGYLLQCLGLNSLALLLCSWVSLRRRREWTALLVTLPSLAYNIASLPAMSGPDYRLFYFNAIVTIPLILASLAKNADQKKVKADYAEKQK